MRILHEDVYAFLYILLRGFLLSQFSVLLKLALELTVYFLLDILEVFSVFWRHIFFC
jgi:hypothetical protein